MDLNSLKRRVPICDLKLQSSFFDTNMSQMVVCDVMDDQSERHEEVFIHLNTN